MATDNMNARKEDKENINVHNPLELRYWSNKLGVTKESILEAVQEAGDSIDEVENILKTSTSASLKIINKKENTDFTSPGTISFNG
jgi:hypothetical protein